MCGGSIWHTVYVLQLPQGRFQVLNGSKKEEAKRKLKEGKQKRKQGEGGGENTVSP